MLQKTKAYLFVVKRKDPDYAIGRAAQLHLRLLLLLRVRDAAPDRPDVEQHREAILRLCPAGDHDPRKLSYLRWYKAITLADIGDEAGLTGAVMDALRADDRLAMDHAYADIGKRQYTLLRRFVEHYLHVLHNHALLGQVCRALQIRQ